MPSVFISYAREDQDFARELFDALCAAGHQPSWDQDHEVVPFSAPWRAEIQSAIDRSEKFIFILSPDSLESRECASELTHAVEVRKHIIPVNRRPSRTGQTIPEAVEELNWIDFTGDMPFEQAFEYLTAALNTDLSWSKTHTRLLARSIEWTTGSRDRSLLLRGSDLRAAEEWASHADDHPQTPPTPTQREYITASRHAADRATRFSRGALALGLAIAILLAGVAFIQRNQARHEANVAQARALAAEATADLAADPSQSLRLALESTQKNTTSTELRALRLALSADKDRMVFQPGFGSGTQAAWSPAGEVIAATGRGNTVQLWNPRTGKLLRILGPMPSAPRISQLSYDRRGNLLVAVAADPLSYPASGHVALWNTQTGNAVPMRQVNRYIATHRTNRAGLNSVAATWDPQNDDLFIYGDDLRGVLVYIPATKTILTLLSESYVSNITFEATGSKAFVLASRDIDSYIDDARIMTFKNDILTTVAALTIPGGWASNHSACWIPNGNEIATWDQYGANDNTLRIFNANTGAQLFQRIGDYIAAACGNSIVAGPYVIAGDVSGNGILVHTTDLFSIGVRREFTAIGIYGHTQAIVSTAASGDGAYIATGAGDGTVRIWSAANGKQLNLISNKSQPVVSVQFSSDDGAVLAVGGDGIVRVADAGVGEPDIRLSAPPECRTYALGFAADNRLVYGLNEIMHSAQTGSAHRITAAIAILWRASTGSVIARYRLPAPPEVAEEECPSAIAITTFCELGAPAKEFSGYTVSSDGRYFGYSEKSGVVVRSFKDKATERLHLSVAATGIEFAGPDDDLLISTTRAVYLWQPLVSGNHLTKIPQPTAPLDAELSADGNRMVTANADGNASLWDTRSGKMIGRFTPHQVHSGETAKTAVDRVALNANGSEIAIGTQYGSIDLLESRDHRLLKTQLLGSAYFAITELDFSEDGSLVVAANYPRIGAGSAKPAATAFILSARTGSIVTTFDSPAQGFPPVNPGVALSPNGNDVLGGVEGFAPATALAGSDAVYDIRTGDELSNLQNALSNAPPIAPGTANIIPLSAWASDGIHLLTGAPNLYACDACGSLAQMQEAATLRLAWATPLTPAHDVPPSNNSFS